MTSDIDICRTAILTVQQNGDGARSYAVQRIDQFLEEGDMESVAMWRRTLKAIDVLLTMRGVGRLN